MGVTRSLNHNAPIHQPVIWQKNTQYYSSNLEILCRLILNKVSKSFLQRIRDSEVNLVMEIYFTH